MVSSLWLDDHPARGSPTWSRQCRAGWKVTQPVQTVLGRLKGHPTGPHHAGLAGRSSNQSRPCWEDRKVTQLVYAIPYRNSICVPCGPHLDSFVGPTWATHFGPKTKCPAGRNGLQVGYPCGLPTLDPIHFVRQAAMGLANAIYVIPYYFQFMLIILESLIYFIQICQLSYSPLRKLPMIAMRNLSQNNTRFYLHSQPRTQGV